MNQIPDDVVVQMLDDGFPIRDDSDRVVTRLGLLATLYFDNGYTEEGREAVAHCFEQYLELYRDEVRWAMDPDSAAWHEFDRRPVATPREWFAEGRGENDQWAFQYHGGETEDEASHFQVHGLGARKWQSDAHGQLSYFSAALPMTWFADHEGSFPKVVLDWCRTLRPLHGYGGIGILESLDTGVAQQNEQTVYGMARRFPGLEVDHPLSHVLFLKQGIKGVNWLTILGDQWVEQLGGVAALKVELGEPFTVHEYPGGVMIQAGPKPQLGDVNRQQEIPEYRELARVLKSIRIQEHRRFQERTGFDPEKTLEWLARFD